MTDYSLNGNQRSLENLSLKLVGAQMELDKTLKNLGSTLQTGLQENENATQQQTEEILGALQGHKEVVQELNHQSAKTLDQNEELGSKLLDCLRENQATIKDSLQQLSSQHVKNLHARQSSIDKAVETLGERVDQSSEQLGDKVDQSSGQLGDKFNKAVGKLGEKLDKSFEQLGERVEKSSGQIGDRINHSVEQLGFTVDKSVEQLGYKVNSSVEQLGDRVDNFSEQLRDTFEQIEGKVDRSVVQLGDEVDESVAQLGDKLILAGKSSNQVFQTSLFNLQSALNESGRTLEESLNDLKSALNENSTILEESLNSLQSALKDNDQKSQERSEATWTIVLGTGGAFIAVLPELTGSASFLECPQPNSRGCLPYGIANIIIYASAGFLIAGLLVRIFTGWFDSKLEESPLHEDLQGAPVVVAITADWCKRSGVFAHRVLDDSQNAGEKNSESIFEFLKSRDITKGENRKKDFGFINFDVTHASAVKNSEKLAKKFSLISCFEANKNKPGTVLILDPTTGNILKRFRRFYGNESNSCRKKKRQFFKNKIKEYKEEIEQGITSQNYLIRDQ